MRAMSKMCGLYNGELRLLSCPNVIHGISILIHTANNLQIEEMFFWEKMLSYFMTRFTFSCSDVLMPRSFKGDYSAKWRLMDVHVQITISLKAARKRRARGNRSFFNSRALPSLDTYIRNSPGQALKWHTTPSSLNLPAIIYPLLIDTSQRN